MFGHQNYSSRAAGIEALGQKGWCANKSATKFFYSCWEGHSNLLKNMGWNTLLGVSSSTVLKVWEGKAMTDICRLHRTMVSMVFIVIVLTFRRDEYVLTVWGDGLCTEGGEQQPSPIKLVCPDSSVIKMVCFRTSYIPLPCGFELH